MTEIERIFACLSENMNFSIIRGGARPLDGITHQSTKNGVTERPRHICSRTRAFSLSSFDGRSNDVSDKQNRRLEGIETTKNNGH